ncbi:MAG: isochorismatase family protein [Anaerolineae bacterium]|nr:isochorismatase family protein [Anaerolineae bacterium]
MSDHPRTALLVIDVQQALFEKSTPIYRAAELLTNINCLIQCARDTGAPIFFIQHANETFLKKDSAGWQLHPDLKPDACDSIIYKQHGSAFQDTALQHEIDSRAIRTLIMTGLVTEGCVRATCLAGHKLGYHVVLVQDGHSSFHKQAASRVDEWNRKLADQGVNVIPTKDIEF